MKILTKKSFRNAVLLVAYWIVFVFAPYSAIGRLAVKTGRPRTDADMFLFNILFFVLAASVIFFVIPYKYAALSSRAQKVLYVIIGLIFPLAAILSAIVMGMLFSATWF